MPHAYNGDIAIHYETFGEGEPLVLIMGLGADGSVWEKHREFYQQKFQCIAIDNRGVGKSSKPTGSYTTEAMASDVIAVIDHLGHSKVRVAGISMGGAIAQTLSINYPERVISQVLISTWARCDTYAKTIFKNMKSHRMHVTPADFMEYLQLLIFAAKHFSDNEPSLMADREAANVDPDLQPQYAFDAQCDACIDHDSTEGLSKINIPTLITVGDRDIFTPLGFSEYIQQHISGAKMIVYPGTGHAHHWETLESFNQDTRDFLLSH
jgi:pimeloyl-ACP methyl ester carboxylesterase